MIILHSHLQPQFKNELFHILHIKKKTVYHKVAKTDMDTHLHYETKRLSEIASGTFDSGLAIYFRMQVK